MTGRRVGQVRELLTELRHRETRRAALGRVRRRATRGLGAVTGRPGHLDGAGTAPRGATGSAASGRPDRWYVAAWSRLVIAVTGADASEGGDPAGVTTDTVARARRQRGAATLADALARGETLERAVVQAVARLHESKDWNRAWAIATGAGRQPGGADAAAMGLGVLWHRRRQFARSWRSLEGLPDDVLAAVVPIEAVDGGLAAGTEASRRRALAIGTPRAYMDAALLVDLAGRFLAFDEPQRAADLVAEVRDRPDPGLDGPRHRALRLIERRLAARPPASPPGAISFGILGPGTPDPDHASADLGDHVQALAVLGNLVPWSDVTFTGEDGLGEVATDLQARVRADLRRPGVTGAVHLVPVDRDSSRTAVIPDRTWVVASGWHMHPLFDLRYDFPYHPSVRPIFVSFHVNQPDMLTDDAIAYLRRHGPVGCRDWTSVFLLLSAGVDAFFTGCITTTVDAVFPSRSDVYRGGGAVGVIDLPRSAAGPSAKRVATSTHDADAAAPATATPADGIRAASVALGGYQRDLARVVTGRLHAYLSLTALGVPVEFRPANAGDIRIPGLGGLTPGDARLVEMQGDLRDLIAEAMGAVLSGASDDEVYARWRDLTSARVTEAKARFAAPVADPPTTIDVAAVVATSKAGSRRFGPHDAVDAATVTDVVICYDQNLTWQAAVMLESMVANASGPLRLWILGRGLADAYLDWLAAAFPALPITHIPCDPIEYGKIGRIPARITISTMDRLLLPHLLEDIARVVYVDIDTLVLDDIVALARTDLGGRPIAARDSYVGEAGEWRAAARRLAEGPALELQRRLGHRHGFGGPALNAGVLVLDLDRMRRDAFTVTYLGWVQRYGLNDQDIMLAYSGPDRVHLPFRWDVLPVVDDIDDPALIHWASVGKPWDRDLTYGQDRWWSFAERSRARSGMPPGSPPPIA